MKMIGVVPLWDTEKQSLWMLPGYMEGIQRAGALPVMLPLTNNRERIEAMAHAVDGFLFTGGQDIGTALYGQKSLPQCGETYHRRDKLEALLFQIAVRERDKPFLGICRGLQMLNVMSGGTLYQDLPTQYSSEVTHQQRPPYDQPMHDVHIVPGSPLHALLGRETLAVNSCHHQGIDQLAPGLVAMAHASDGLVEAAVLPDRRFAWAVQWHPEFVLDDPASAALFRAFVTA